VRILTIGSALLAFGTAVLPHEGSAQAASPRLQEVQTCSRPALRIAELAIANDSTGGSPIFNCSWVLSREVNCLARESDTLANGIAIGAIVGAPIGYFVLAFATGGDAYPNRTIAFGVVVGALVGLFFDSQR